MSNENGKNNELVIKNENNNIDLSQYSPEEIQKFNSLTNDLAVVNNESILNFGSDLQKQLAQYSDDFLNNIKSFDAGEIGGTINDLLHELSYADPEKQGIVKKTLLKIPGVNKLVKNTDKLLKKYESVSGNIDSITSKMDNSRIEIIKDNVRLDDLYEKNKEMVHNLEDYIIAGHIKIDELNNEIAEMENNPDDYDHLDIADKKEFVSRLSKRVYDMELTRSITYQTLPQIRLVQNNNNTMAEKIQSSLTSTIPVWKNQISIAVTLKRQKQVAEIQNKIYETTNDILSKNADNLKQNSIDIAKQNERGIVSLDTIKEVNTNLVNTLKEIRKIKQDGEATRKSLTKELNDIEKTLKSNINEVNKTI